jgi:hypothetical protein
MTKAQEVYERVEALVASGMKKADAFRQVAEEFGQPFNSMRGAYYAHTRSLEGGTPTRRSRRGSAPPVDPIDAASEILTKALVAIDAELAEAKSRADQAAADYAQLQERAEERKAVIQTKIDALST